MKGFYVKTGQVISTRVDLFPPAYTEKLQALQDGIEAMPYELVEAVVRQELLDGAPLSDLFLDFEKEPLGAASIAQVHKATLLDGRTVAVKLQVSVLFVQMYVLYCLLLTYWLNLASECRAKAFR